MYRLKKNILARSKIDIIVASKYMLNMVQNSPILSDNRVHYIPFGVDTNIFRPMDSAGLRSKYGISKNSNVISFRETDSEYKGLSYIKEALKRIKLNGHKNPITLLTVNHKGLLTEFEDKYDVVELGMVTDESIMAEFYNCSDIFLMPSTAEAFGMMAIESMACGTPVIVFDGTSLPEVIFAPTGGISVPMKDDGALYSAIKRLLENADERKNIGEQAYRLSRVHYNFEDHARKILSLYVDVIARRKTDNLLA
jgi:glycosyltransferase involved in cell wall biosynthesis